MPRGSAARLGVIALALVLALSLGSLIVPGAGSRAVGSLSLGHDPLVLAAELEGGDPVDLGVGTKEGSQGGTRELVDLPEPRRERLLDPDARRLQAGLTLGLANGLETWLKVEGAATESVPEADPRDQRHRRVEDLDWAALLDELRDDDVRWNATYAGRELLDRCWDGRISEEQWAAAEARLASGDRQQEILVTGLLMRMVTRSAEPGLPSRPLHPVLRQRALAWLDGSPSVGFYCALNTGRGLATRVCMIHVSELQTELGTIAGQVGHRARFRAAFVLGATGRTAWSKTVGEALVPHLRSNRIQGDACMALHALKQLGPFVAPQLALARAGADPQQARCIDALLAECDEIGSGASVDLRGVSWRTRSPLEHWSYVPGWDSTRVAPWIRKD